MVSDPVRIVGIDAGGFIGGGVPVNSRTDTPTVYNVTLTLANTEYSQALPTDCKGFEFHCRTAYDVRFAKSKGKNMSHPELKSGSPLLHWSW